MTYNPNEKRDSHGRWTASSAGLPKAVAKELEAAQAWHAKRATGRQALAHQFATKEEAQIASNKLSKLVGQGIGAQRRENYIISAAPLDMVESVRNSVPVVHVHHDRSKGT